MSEPLWRQLEGLKFPDEMVTRFFFKTGQARRADARVLELGCGNAANLALFGAYGWHCQGLDIDAQALEQGRRNFARQGLPAPRLVAADLNDALPDFGPLDTLLLPSSLYYVSPARAGAIVAQLAPRLRPGAWLFCRVRAPGDHRWGCGKAVGDRCWTLDTDETAELGCTIAFYDEPALHELLAPLGLLPETVRVMRLDFDNLGPRDTLIANRDLVLWGRCA